MNILEKISSYNLFNYLLPGILFAIIAKKFTPYDFIQQDVIVGAFLYYFFGMVISRFGSLIVEPFLKWTSFLKFSDYKKYVVASKKDEKIELLSEVNNTYRTIASMFILLLIIKGYGCLEDAFDISEHLTNVIVIILILVMFLLSYRKQTNYITKRIDANS